MVMSQDEINTAVIGSLRMGDSLYGINSSEFRRAKPTVVLTQAPSTANGRTLNSKLFGLMYLSHLPKP